MRIAVIAIFFFLLIFILILKKSQIGLQILAGKQKAWFILYIYQKLGNQKNANLILEFSDRKSPKA